MKKSFTKRLSEEEVRTKLNIEDFAHLPKNKIAEFTSYLGQMDPEVAKVALAQVPEFALTARAAIDNVQKIVSKGFESNDDSMKFFHATVNNYVHSLNVQLDNPSISQQERENISKELLEVIKLVAEKDSENKKHIQIETTKTIIGLLGAVAMVGASIGLSIVLKTPVKLK